MNYNIKPMTIEHALAVSKWKYVNDYSIYSMDESQETIDELLDGSYYSVFSKVKLIGFFCFGRSAQIVIGEAADFYVDCSYTDIGLGIKPEFCGKGLGLDFMIAGIEFAKSNFASNKFRLTVANFNKRAIKVYERAGFSKFGSIVRNSDGREFEVMVKDR